MPGESNAVKRWVMRRADETSQTREGGAPIIGIVSVGVLVLTGVA